MSLSVLTRTPRKLVRLRNVSVSSIESASDARVYESMNDVTLDLYACRTYAFLTEGCSPILRVLARLTEPERGKVTWGSSLFAWGKPTPVAYLPKGVRLSHDVLVRDELLTALAHAGANIDHDDFNQIVNDLRLDDVLEQRTASLPQDVIYRVMIARALMLGARLIVLDEPTVSMSPAAAESLLKSVLSLGNAEYTVVIQTRSPEVAAQCGHVFLLINGQLVGSFDAPEVTGLRVEYSAAMGATEALNRAQQLSAWQLSAQQLSTQSSSTDEATDPSLSANCTTARQGLRDAGPALGVLSASAERDATSADEGVAAPRWVPTRSTEHTPLTPIPDAQRQPGSLDQADGELEVQVGTDSPTKSAALSDGDAQAEAAAARGAKASAEDETAQDTDTRDQDETQAVKPDREAEGKEPSPARPTLSSSHRPTFPSSLVERPQERFVILEDAPDPLTGQIPTVIVEPAPVTTALPLIPRTSRDAIDADAEKVIEQAHNILKGLPGSVVPQENDTTT